MTVTDTFSIPAELPARLEKGLQTYEYRYEVVINDDPTQVLTVAFGVAAPTFLIETQEGDSSFLLYS